MSLVSISGSMPLITSPEFGAVITHPDRTRRFPFPTDCILDGTVDQWFVTAATFAAAMNYVTPLHFYDCGDRVSDSILDDTGTKGVPLTRIAKAGSTVFDSSNALLNRSDLVEFPDDASSLVGSTLKTPPHDSPPEVTIGDGNFVMLWIGFVSGSTVGNPAGIIGTRLDSGQQRGNEQSVFATGEAWGIIRGLPGPVSQNALLAGSIYDTAMCFVICRDNTRTDIDPAGMFGVYRWDVNGGCVFQENPLTVTGNMQNPGDFMNVSDNVFTRTGYIGYFAQAASWSYASGSATNFSCENMIALQNAMCV